MPVRKPRNASRAQPAVPPPLPRSTPIERPPYRRLRAFAFDPTLAIRSDLAETNRIVIRVPWEYDVETGEDALRPGPIGEYLEVIDVDPASQACYQPVDLNHPYLLAQDGLEPLDTNPMFHQQMLYAVAMTTIHNFEQVLGRPALWAPRTREKPGSPGEAERPAEYVPRLRVYPHALREANAYYSPAKKALLFGYFPAPVADLSLHLPGDVIFTCLSHDVVAHETAHALLDGMQCVSLEPTNRDVLAFHEAFADMVALFQHFSFPEVLRNQIALTRGDLETENLLAQLAQEVGAATGLHGALRDALGSLDPVTGQWHRTVPMPSLIRERTEPHERGALLVSAIFNAFLSLYRRRTRDLLMVATRGTGELPAGQLLPDLVNRLAAEAAAAAQYVLSRCILALDYLPPVDLTFGDFLQAIITADFDLAPADEQGFRTAIVEAFRASGIYPVGRRGLSIQSLRWRPPMHRDLQAYFPHPLEDTLARLALKGDAAGSRERIWQVERRTINDLQKYLDKLAPSVQTEMGLEPNRPGARVTVRSAHLAQRVDGRGRAFTDLVLQVIQERAGYFDEGDQEAAEAGRPDAPPRDFTFFGGCTLLINLQSRRVRYCISKNIWSQRRLDWQRAYLASDDGGSQRSLYFGSHAEQVLGEPFALLHRAEVSA